MRKYQIWDKTSKVITPIGEVLSPEEWMDRYPMARLDEIDLVIGAGTINGSYCMEYSSFKDMYESQGADFSNCETKEDVLRAIEAFDEEVAAQRQAEAEARSNEISTQERIAAALEAQVLLSMPDAE